MQSKEYWNKKIIAWEKSSYEGNLRDLGLIERIATRFRGPIKKRRGILLSLLKDSIKDKTILELGCGSGELCFEFLKLGAARVTGVDISDVAIKAACEKASEMGLQNKADFVIMDVRKDLNLPNTDFVVGLGFIDYVDIGSLKRLFSKIKGRFIFSFPEKKKNLINMMHLIYLKSQKCPAFYKFNRREFKNVPGVQDKFRFFTIHNMTFIANFDPAGCQGTAPG